MHVRIAIVVTGVLYNQAMTAISKPCPSFTAVCEETNTVTSNFFQVLAKNSLIKNIFEEEKSLIVGHNFFFGK